MRTVRIFLFLYDECEKEYEYEWILFFCVWWMWKRIWIWMNFFFVYDECEKESEYECEYEFHVILNTRNECEWEKEC